MKTKIKLIKFCDFVIKKEKLIIQQNHTYELVHMRDQRHIAEHSGIHESSRGKDANAQNCLSHYKSQYLIKMW
jgi:hypothetical protein